MKIALCLVACLSIMSIFAEEEKDKDKDKVNVATRATADDDISRLIAQAIAAYARISDAFVAQEYEKFVPWLSKGGKPVISAEASRSKANIEVFTRIFKNEIRPADQRATAGMVKELKAAELPMAPAEVEITNTSTYVELERGSGKYNSVTNRTITTVRIPCS